MEIGKHIKGIFFDFDGVITVEKTGRETMISYISKYTDIPYEIVEAAYTRHNKALLYGEITHRDMWDEFCEEIGRKLDFEVLEKAFLNVTLDTNIVQFIRNHKDKYLIGMITDNRTDRIEAIIEQTELKGLFDVIVISANVHSRKSDAKIFREALKQSGLKAEECVFIDNTKSNLIVPGRMGFQTIYFDDVKRKGINVISERASEVLKQHQKADDIIGETKAFLYDMLAPTPDRGDMLYRYEHSIRVAENGIRIAKAESLPLETLTIACLLHDVGYREIEHFEDLHYHAFVSSEIARIYLDNIGYDAELSEEIVKGVARHSLTDNLPDDMTPFQMSVRDSDDIDRFDIFRTAMAAGDCVHEKTNSEIIESCNAAIEKAKWVMSLKRGTKTAKQMMDANLEKRISILEDILRQAKKGF
ncbi:MAG: HAD-IA family hydrolase [Acetatifactor sp.]|nr:HAD-IA family hydrolase [Acetatifactor sp.]